MTGGGGVPNGEPAAAEGDEYEPPSWEDIIANLLEHQNCPSWEDIGKLTPRQVFDYYYRPRDDKGNPLPFRWKKKAKTVNTDDPEVQRRMWMDIGRAVIKGGKANFTEEELVAAWEEGERRRKEREQGGST